LFTKFKTQTRKLFLDPSAEAPKNLLKGEKLDIILSPSLYWVKKISLPVNNVREVIKLLPSIFEEFLPEGDYSYTAYKYEDEFFVFAYEDKKILKLFNDKGINSADVAGVYLAQSAFTHLEKPVKINDSQVMYAQEGVLVLTPLAWVNEYDELSLEETNLGKHKLNLQLFVSIVDKKSLYKIAAVFLALILVFVVEIFITSSKIDEINNAREELFTKYKLQSTMMQNRSTFKKYTKIYKQQTRLREEIQKLLNRKLKNSEHINFVSYKDSIFKFKIGDGEIVEIKL